MMVKQYLTVHVISLRRLDVKTNAKTAFKT